MKFEIFIPAQKNVDFDLTLRVEANTWMDSLKIGLSRLGEDSSLIKHLMVDVKEDCFHVTETLNHRVFKISEIPEEKIEPKQINKIQSEEKAKKEVGLKKEQINKIQSEEKAKKEVGLKKEKFYKQEKTQIEDIIKTPTKKIKLGRIKKESNIDDLLTEIYFDISVVGEKKDISDAMETIMDFSMKYIDCDSGSIYLVDIDKSEYYFSAIRGPKAEVLRKLNLRLPIGVGLAGFSIKEDLSLAISDVNKDKRFYKSISDKLGYPTYSMLTIPISYNGMVYGAIQLINKKNNNLFDLSDINILSYLAKYSGNYLARKNKQL